MGSQFSGIRLGVGQCTEAVGQCVTGVGGEARRVEFKVSETFIWFEEHFNSFYFIFSHLDLCGSSVSLEAVQEVLAQCPKLNSINLASCRSLPRGMKRLLQGPGEMRDLREALGVELRVPAVLADWLSANGRGDETRTQFKRTVQQGRCHPDSRQALIAMHSRMVGWYPWEGTSFFGGCVSVSVSFSHSVLLGVGFYIFFCFFLILFLIFLICGACWGGLLFILLFSCHNRGW